MNNLLNLIWWNDPIKKEIVSKKISESNKGRQASWITSTNREEICKKISIAKTGVKNPKTSAKLKGRKQTPKRIKQMSEYLKVNPIKYWLGKKRPDMSERMSKLNKGRKVSPETRLKMSISLTGLKRSEETKKKMSISRRGNNSPLWKGGVSKIYKRIRAGLDFRLWRESVFRRDDWTCQICYKKGSVLAPHHIENFWSSEKKRFDVDNGITLCENCHKLFHHINGNKYNNIAQLLKFKKEYEKVSDKK